MLKPFLGCILTPGPQRSQGQDRYSKWQRSWAPLRGVAYQETSLPGRLTFQGTTRLSADVKFHTCIKRLADSCAWKRGGKDLQNRSRGDDTPLLDHHIIINSPNAVIFRAQATGA